MRPSALDKCAFVRDPCMSRSVLCFGSLEKARIRPGESGLQNGGANSHSTSITFNFRATIPQSLQTVQACNLGRIFLRLSEGLSCSSPLVLPCAHFLIFLLFYTKPCQRTAPHIFVPNVYLFSSVPIDSPRPSTTEPFALLRCKPASLASFLPISVP